MSSFNHYPEFKDITETPYYLTIQQKIMYAKEFAPHKVGYYTQLLKELKNRECNIKKFNTIKN